MPRGDGVKMFNENSFPLLVAGDKQFPFLLASGQVYSAIVQSPKGLFESDKEQPERF